MPAEFEYEISVYIATSDEHGPIVFDTEPSTCELLDAWEGRGWKRPVQLYKVESLVNGVRSELILDVE